jgi:hypothetical protein
MVSNAMALVVVTKRALSGLRELNHLPTQGFIPLVSGSLVQRPSGGNVEMVLTLELHLRSLPLRCARLLESFGRLRLVGIVCSKRVGSTFRQEQTARLNCFRGSTRTAIRVVRANFIN